MKSKYSDVRVTRSHLRLVANDEHTPPVPNAGSFRRYLRRATGFCVTVSTGVLRASIWAVRNALFYVLFWLRLIIRPLLMVAATLGLVAVVLGALFKPEWAYLLKIAGFSFACFLLAWLYDSVLLFLAPAPMILEGRSD